MGGVRVKEGDRHGVPERDEHLHGVEPARPDAGERVERGARRVQIARFCGGLLGLLRVVKADDLNDEELLATMSCDELLVAVVAQSLDMALVHLGR